jgi:lysine-N-methylase
MLADGPAPAVAAAAAAPNLAPDRPIVPLPGYRFRCDGRGSCCRTFPTTLFSPIEMVRARALAPGVLDGGVQQDAVFLPERGAPAAQRVCSVTMVDGRCAYLAESGRCALHEAGGPEGKPLGCRVFPACLTDDGDTVRMSIAPECACVLSSLEGAGGGPLAAGLRTAADLPIGAHVDRLAGEVVPAPGRAWGRQAYLAWAAVLESSGVATAGADVDVPVLYTALAAALAGHTDPADAARAGLAGVSSVDVTAELAGERARLGAAVAIRVERDAAWRSERDLACLVPRWITAALAVLEGEHHPATPAVRAREHLCFRAALHGHRWAIEGEPMLAEALRARAVRLLVARCLPGLYGDTADPALSEPIALVEAVCRGFGL